MRTLSDSSTVTIAGGGLSGLAAALAVARRGRAAHVFERRRDVGARFHGDFQGLEDWSTEGDVLEELESLEIAPTFSYAPFRECVFVDPDGREHVCRSSKPLWYLVRRGTDAGTLDQKEYLARTVKFFERTVGVRPRDARAFGGFANMSAAVLFAGIVAVVSPSAAQTPPAGAPAQGQQDHQAHQPAPAEQPVSQAQETEMAGMQQKMMAECPMMKQMGAAKEK